MLTALASIAMMIVATYLMVVVGYKIGDFFEWAFERVLGLR